MLKPIIIFVMSLLLALQPAFALDLKSKQMILVDDTTGTVLHAIEPDSQMFPSSMSKLMTLYVLFEKLKQGGITLQSTMQVSEKAWRMAGSKMFVHVGDEVAVEDLIRGIVIQSGNDACVVVAEAIGGTEEGFARMMTSTAKKLGMKNSQFRNSTGWPDEQHYTTARDLAILSSALIRDFPDYYPYFAEESYTYNKITQANRNGLLSRSLGVDGLKTGHTEIAGYGIAVSALDKASNRRLVVVVNGLNSEKERLDEAATLVQYGFREYQAFTAPAEMKPFASLPVFMGKANEVAVTLQPGAAVSIPRDREELVLKTTAQAPLVAPVEKGTVVGQMEVHYKDTLLKTLPIVTAEPVERVGFFSRLWRKLLILFAG